MLCSAKGKAFWLPFLLFSIDINTTPESLPLQEEKNLLIWQLGTGESVPALCQKDPSFLPCCCGVIIKENIIGMLSPGGPSNNHHTVHAHRASWFTTHILLPMGAQHGLHNEGPPSHQTQAGPFLGWKYRKVGGGSFTFLGRSKSQGFAQWLRDVRDSCRLVAKGTFVKMPGVHKIQKLCPML